MPTLYMTAMHRLGVKRSSSTFNEQSEQERVTPPSKRLKQCINREIPHSTLSGNIGNFISATWSWFVTGLRQVMFGNPQERVPHHHDHSKEMPTRSTEMEMNRSTLKRESTQLISREFTPANTLPFITSSLSQNQSVSCESNLPCTLIPSPVPLVHHSVSDKAVTTEATQGSFRLLKKQHNTRCGVSKSPSLFSTVLSPEVIGPQSTRKDSSFSRVPSFYIPDTAHHTPSTTRHTPQHNISSVVGKWKAPDSMSSSGHFKADTISKQVQTSHVTGHVTAKPQQLPEAYHMKKWLQDFKTNHKHSVEERRALLEVAEKKLRLHQQDRLTIEDARVSRLRTLLGLSSIIDNVPVKRELNLEDTHQERVTVMTLLQGQPNECISQKFNIRITRGDLRTLSGLQWLNDEVINFYLNLIKERSEIENGPKVHVFSTFFYPKLSQAGYSGVRRWTKKVDVFAQDLLLFPIHMGMHWCLAVVDFRKKQFQYYDSLNGSNPACFRRLKEYLVMESQDKKKVDYTLDEWTCVIPTDIPCQENGSDCGVFTCMYARHLSTDSRFDFSQQMMPAIREHMMIEIVRQCLI